MSINMHTIVETIASYTSRLNAIFGMTIVAAILFCSLGHAQFVNPGSITVTLVEVANVSGSGAPNYGFHAYDGTDRLFVTTQQGEVRLIKDGALLSTPFLDIPAAGVPLSIGFEKGLLGLAFHPNFAATGATPGSGKFYTYTSEPQIGTPDFNHPELVPGNLGDHHSVIREWTVDSLNQDRIDTAISSRDLLRINQPQVNHNGGALAFGPDNNLYISLGDGGGGNDHSSGIDNSTDGHTNGGGGNSQDITNVFGSILRIDPLGTGSINSKYGIPDNPFVNKTGVDEIFAYGLRNPFRISFDRQTGNLYAGDVGQSAREEVNLIVKEGNYGWVNFEGSLLNRGGGPAFEETVAPIAEYNNNEEGISIIGGFVYRGSLLPNLQGKYVFGDFGGPLGIAGRLFYLDLPNGAIQEFMITPEGHQLNTKLHGFGEDREGELYLMMANGDVLRIEGMPGDFNADLAVDDTDIDLLRQAIEQMNTDPLFDLNGDTSVDSSDVTHLIDVILETRIGDINLDRIVDSNDLAALRVNFGISSPAPLPWSQGDVIGDGIIDETDEAALRFNFGFENLPATPSAPEPGTLMLLSAAVMLQKPNNAGMMTMASRSRS